MIRKCTRLFGVAAALSVLAMAGVAFAEGEVEVKIKLPEPYFGGTPLNYYGPNLEEKSYKPRPPLMAPEGTTNVAAGKTVTSSAPDTNFGKLSMATDGDKSYEETSLVEIGKGPQWVQIDLGAPQDIYGVLVWHYHAADRVYFDTKIKVADNAEFTENVREVFNNDHDNSSKAGVGKHKEYIENHKGKLVPIPDGQKAQFVRLYSNGNTSDENNHYVEVEVFGKAAD
jgi:hypothetical protein